MTRATMSNNADALLREAVRASGLQEVGGDRYDGVTLEGTLEEWGALAQSALTLREGARGSDRRVLTHAIQRNPAMHAVAQVFWDFRRWNWKN